MKFVKYSRNWRFRSSDHWIVSRASWALAHFFGTHVSVILTSVSNSS